MKTFKSIRPTSFPLRGLLLDFDAADSERRAHVMADFSDGSVSWPALLCRCPSLSPQQSSRFSKLQVSTLPPSLHPSLHHPGRIRDQEGEDCFCFSAFMRECASGRLSQGEERDGTRCITPRMLCCVLLGVIIQVGDALTEAVLGASSHYAAAWKPALLGRRTFC